MACLLQRITSMKLQNNWYVWQINLNLSSSCLVAHKATVLPLVLVSCYGLCFLPRLPSCFYPFLFNCVPPGGFWFSSCSLSFSFVPNSLLCCSVDFLDWSCHSILCAIIFHLSWVPSLLKGFMSPLFSRYGESGRSPICLRVFPQSMEMWKHELVFGHKCRCSFASPPPRMWIRNV